MKENLISKEEAIKILKNNIESKFNKVKELLETASDYYYNTDQIILSDKDYDLIYNKYISLTNDIIVGAPPKSQKGTINVKHQYSNLVGTLKKAQDLNECNEFIKDITESFDTFDLQANEFVVNLSLKFDGNSVTFECDENGNIEKALTRGRNGQGKDLTNVFKDFKPKNSIKMDEKFAIKNEIIIDYKNFEIISKLLESDYANPRSQVSGILGSDDAYKYFKYFTIVPLTLKTLNDTIPNNKETMICEAENIHYTFNKEIEYIFGKDNYYHKYSKLIRVDNYEDFKNEVKKYYDYVNKIRSTLPFMIDGIVIDILNEEVRNKLGYNPSGSIPKFSIALKLPYLEEETIVEDCEFCVGTHGRITPLIHFKPIHFNGTEHTKQQVSSVKRLNDLRIGKGSKILVTYNNDCLSYISKIECDHNKNIKPFEYPKVCPSCGEKIYFITNNKTKEVTLAECRNENCKVIKIGKIINYLTVMDYKGIKESIIEKLYDAGLINDITDFYCLDYDKVSNIDGLGKGTCKIIKDEIQRKEYYDFEILGALSIKDIALESAKIICQNYSIDELIDLYNDDKLVDALMRINTIGKVKAKNFDEGFGENWEVINFLLERGFKEIKKEIASNSNSSESLKIVFTGFRDPKLQFELEKRGHKVTSSVSGKTDILVHDGNPGATKLKAAKEKGIKIMELSKFLEEFNI